MRPKRKTTLSEVIRWRRVTRGYSLRDVEKLTGMTSAAISQIETGHTKNPSFQSVVKLARALTLSISSLAEIVS